MTTQEQKLIEDSLFIKWVYHNNPSVERYWQKFFDEHPEEKNEILAFKDRLYDLKSFDEFLNPSEKALIASNIQVRINLELSRKKRITLIKSVLRYAAVAVIFFSIGGLQVYYFMSRTGKSAAITDVAVPVATLTQGPLLITSKGENVRLFNTNSTVDYTRKGEIVLNEDSIIKSSTDQPNVLNQLVIPYGNQSRILLSDNTVVWLNAGSRLLYPSSFTGKTREVILYGEGYFEVSKNKEQPFIVKTTTMDVKVLGTEFNLSAYTEDNVVQTVLKEGSVSIRPKDAGFFENDVVIKPNEMASFNKSTNDTKVYPVDASYYKLWTKGLISFDEVDFKRVIRKVERFYNVSITFSDPAKEIIRISGKLDLKQSRQEVMEYLSKVSLSKFDQISDKEYIIK